MKGFVQYWFLDGKVSIYHPVIRSTGESVFEVWSGTMTVESIDAHFATAPFTTLGRIVFRKELESFRGGYK